MKVLLSIKPEFVEKIFSGENGLNTENLHSKMLILTLSLFTLPCPLEKL